MPNSKQAAKRLRQDKKRTAHNSLAKDNISYILRQAKKQIEAKDAAKAKEFVLKFQKAIDRAISDGVIHRNTGSRRKSRLMAKLNALK